MGCDISFVVLTPFELTEKYMQGKVSFKELSQYLCLKTHLYMCH